MGKHNVLLWFTAEMAAAYIARGRKSDLVTRPRDPGADLAEEVDSLLAALPLRPGKVWVLTSDVWTGMANVAADVVRRVEPRQLPQMVGFEVEPLSGISSSQARTAVQELGQAGSERQFWVTQAEVAQFERIAESVGFNGGKLQGLLHPAGVPAAVDPAGGGGPWRRLEIWSDAVLLVSGEGKGVEHRFLDEGASLAFDSARLEQLAAESGGTLTVLQDPDSVAAPEVSDRIRFASLEDEAYLKALLAAWSRSLAGKAKAPLIAPQRAPMSSATRGLLTAGLAAAAVLGCFGHLLGTDYINRQRVAALDKQSAELKAPLDAMTASKKQLSELDKSLKDVSAKQESLAAAITNYQQTMRGQRDRMPAMLRSLAHSCGSELLIRQIECDGSEVRIHGRCLDPRQAKSLAACLARDLGPMGLIVELPTTEALNLTADGGPHEFELLLRDKNG